MALQASVQALVILSRNLGVMSGAGASSTTFGGVFALSSHVHLNEWRYRIRQLIFEFQYV